jgi:glutamate synthase domain-containing protein 2
MQVLACKLLRKCHKDQVPTGVIETTEKCVTGVQMNWATFLVNQFLMDCREAQDKGTNSIMHGY